MIMIVVAIVVLLIVLALYSGSRTQKRAEDAIEQLYKVLAIKDGSPKNKIANTAILYVLVDSFFLLQVPGSSKTKRMKKYVEFIKKDEISDDDCSFIMEFLFNNMRNAKLSPKAKIYSDFIKELSKSISLFIETYKNGSPLLETIGDAASRKELINQEMNRKIAMFNFEVSLVVKDFLDRKEFPVKFSELN